MSRNILGTFINERIIFFNNTNIFPMNEGKNLHYNKYNFYRSQIYITDNGFIGSSLKNEDLVVKSLNSFFLTLSFFYHPPLISPIMKNDLLNANANKDINIISYQLDSLNKIYMIDNDIRPHQALIGFLFLDDRQVRNALSFAKLIYTSPYNERLLENHLSWSLQSRKQYRESFITSWWIIESYIFSIIRDYYINEKEIHQEDVIDELIDITVYKALEKIRKRNIKTLVPVKTLHEIREKRNDIIHKGMIPGKRISKKAGSIAHKIFWFYLKKSGIDYNKYYKNK